MAKRLLLSVRADSCITHVSARPSAAVGPSGPRESCSRRQRYKIENQQALHLFSFFFWEGGGGGGGAVNVSNSIRNERRLVCLIGICHSQQIWCVSNDEFRLCCNVKWLIKRWWWWGDCSLFSGGQVKSVAHIHIIYFVQEDHTLVSLRQDEWHKRCTCT